MRTPASRFRRRRRRRPRVIPIRQVIPNLLTTLALSSGLASIHLSLLGDFRGALLAIAVAAVFDALDGRAARFLRVTTRFGAELDSLADFLSFGVAPAVLLHQWLLGTEDILGLAAVVTYVVCCALRLARFNATQDRIRPGSPFASFFVGMPAPAAAGAVLVPPLLHLSQTFTPALPAWLVVGHTFLVAWFMISRQPMFSIKHVRIPRRRVAPILVVAALTVAAATRDTWLTIAVLALAYMLTLPLSIVAYRRARYAHRRGPREIAATSVEPAAANSDGSAAR